jgi:hypothetical protein
MFQNSVCHSSNRIFRPLTLLEHATQATFECSTSLYLPRDARLDRGFKKWGDEAEILYEKMKRAHGGEGFQFVGPHRKVSRVNRRC